MEGVWVRVGKQCSSQRQLQKEWCFLRDQSIAVVLINHIKGKLYT